MNILNQIVECIEIFSDFINNIAFFILFIVIIIIFHILVYIIKDLKYLKVLRDFKDIDEVKLEKLRKFPVVNVIIPAWKEGKEFQDLLCSVNNLSYPNLKIIVNAGGNEETINIANQYKENKRFLILHQKRGKDRAALGKILALNECIEYISEGLLYFIDGDSYLTDEILLRMVISLINHNEHVVAAGYRPIKSQEKIDLVKYLHISRLGSLNAKFSRYRTTTPITGANTCISYEVMKKIGKFTEDRMIAEDVSRGEDIISAGFKIYILTDYRAYIYTDYPNTLKEFFEQRKRYIQNSYLRYSSNKNLKTRLKFIILFSLSLYFLALPLFLFFKIGLFFIGALIFLYFYLKKVKQVIVFKKRLGDKREMKFSLSFYLKLIIYLYIWLIFNIVALLGLIKYKRELKTEKDLSN